MPKIIPIKELKNTSKISEQCMSIDEPIFITKNGYGDMVIMSMKVYEETIAKAHAAKLINDSLDDVNNGAKLIDGEEYFEEIIEKYGK